MKWRDLTDPGSSIQRRHGFDESENKMLIKSWQPDMGDCLALNQALFNLESSNSTSLWNGRSMVRVASVPLWLIEKWKNEEGLNYFDPNDQPGLLARLNSSEYAHLRTAPGRL